MHCSMRMAAAALCLPLTVALAGCSLGGGQQKPAGPAAADHGTTATGPRAEGEVVLVTHGSFSLPQEVLDGFTQQTGYQLTVQTGGDAGELTNQLVLTKGSPIGDAVFGIDSTFASRPVEAGVLQAYTPEKLPEGAQAFALDGDAAAYLTPVDYGDVCINIDDTWFAEKSIPPPQTFEDLTKAPYRDLFVTPGASTSSPGLAFLLATIGHFGQDGWQGYWTDLMANGTKVTSGWTDAYTVDFTAGGGGGDRPIVLSYASSPPSTIPKGGDTPTTSALLDTCYRQVEYAGVLQGAKNPEGAQELVDYLLSDEVQAAVPDSMYVYPVSSQVQLPEVWATWAKVAPNPIELDPALIDANRQTWLREWADLATS